MTAYTESFSWLQHAQSTTGTGARPESFTPIGDAPILHGLLETLSGSESVASGMRLSQSDAVITLAQFPAVTEKDRLYHLRFADTYEITGIVRKLLPNETVCQVTKYRTQMSDQ